MRILVAAACLVASSPGDAEPLFAISDETLVARSAVGPAWAGDDRDLGAALRLGTLVNRHVLAADADLAFVTGDGSTLTALPSAGLKLKFLSTPENMGYTYLYAGARIVRTHGETSIAPCAGVRDFITYDIVRPWAFALEWHALVTAPEGRDGLAIEGGLSVGIARAEETSRNFAVLVGWRRDRFDTEMASIRSDGAFVTVTHQWR